MPSGTVIKAVVRVGSAVAARAEYKGVAGGGGAQVITVSPECRRRREFMPLRQVMRGCREERLLPPPQTPLHMHREDR